MTQAELLEQSWGAQIQGGQALTAGLMGQRTSQEGLAATRCAMNEQILTQTDPVTTGETGELRPIHSSMGTEVEVLDTGALPQLREL